MKTRFIIEINHKAPLHLEEYAKALEDYLLRVTKRNVTVTVEPEDKK